MNRANAWIGAGLALLGAVLCIVSFTVATWFDGIGDGTFGTIRTVVLRLPDDVVSGGAKAYFSWAAWIVFGVTAVAAFAANAPIPSARVWRVAGAILGVLGIALTFWGIELSARTDYSELLSHTQLGFYLALAGFLLLIVGALFTAVVRPPRQSPHE